MSSTTPRSGPEEEHQVRAAVGPLEPCAVTSRTHGSEGAGAQQCAPATRLSYPHLLTPAEKLADAKKLLCLPRIVVICGSTRFMTEMNEADLRETKAGKIRPVR